MSRAKLSCNLLPKVKTFLKVRMACFGWSLKPGKIELFYSARMEQLGRNPRFMLERPA